MAESKSKIKLFIDNNIDKALISLLKKRKEILYKIIKAQKSIVKMLETTIKAKIKTIKIQKGNFKNEKT